MPFAVIALVLGAASLLGLAASSNSQAGDTLRGLTPESLETAAVGVVAVIGLVILLVPGALVRILYGRRPAVPGSGGNAALTAEERAMTRFDREEMRGSEP